MFHVFWWCTWYNLEYLTLNKNCQPIQTHHAMLELSFSVYCFCTVILCFSTCNNKSSFEEQHFYSSFLILIFVASQEQICVVHLFHYFLCSWTLLPCLYLHNCWSISFFILCSAKYPLCFMIWSILCSKFLSTSLGKSK